MGQRSNDATVMGARIMPSEEECVSSMGQKYTNDAASKDAQIKLRREEYASGMEQRSNDAVLRDAKVIFRGEECALNMEQGSNDAAAKVAPM